MRLLLVSPLPPPIGGIASWTENFLSHYSKNINNWEIIHQNTAIKFRSITNNNILHRFYSGFRDTKNILYEFKRNLITFRPDVIHVTSSASLALIKDLLLIRVAKKRNIPIIIHFRFGRIPEIAKLCNWEWWLLCKVVSQSNRVIVLDEKSYNTLISNGFKNMENIPNPISDELEQIGNQYQYTPSVQNASKVIFVGHILPEKGVFELVKACISISQIKELLLIGPYENWIKEKLLLIAKQRDNGSWLTFTGSLEKKEVYKYFKSAYLLALPSYTEGFPNVILEAMIFKCPVVASNVGAIPEMLGCSTNNPGGICVTPKSIDELKNAIINLILDTKNTEVLANNAFNRVLAYYTMSSICKQYENLWHNALQH